MNVIIIYIVLKTSARIERFIGQNGINIIRKIFGVVLLAIAVKLFAHNIKATKCYPHVTQIEHEKVLEILKASHHFQVKTNKNTYSSKIIVVAVGYTSLMRIKGLENHVEPHPRAAVAKDRIWLKNTDHLIEDNLYVAGTLAGWRSQFAIASGSGAHVATDILTLWNDGKHAKVHDKV